METTDTLTYPPKDTTEVKPEVGALTQEVIAIAQKVAASVSPDNFTVVFQAAIQVTFPR